MPFTPAFPPPTNFTPPASFSTVPEDRSRVAPVWHTVVFIIVTLALTGFQAQQTPDMTKMHVRNRVPLYAVMIAFELVLFAYVWFLGLRPAGKRIRDIVGGRWNTWHDFWRDIGIACLFWMAVAGMLITLRFVLGANNEGLEAVKFLIPRTPSEVVVWVLLSTTAGFCEELIFRGYLQRQFLAFTGRIEFAVVLQALVFGAAHLYQGWKGAVTITVYGALFGILAAWRKSLRPGMIQHALQDTAAGVGGFFFRNHLPLLLNVLR